MIPRMSDADEQRLFDAFDGMQAHVSSGDTPNEAAITPIDPTTEAGSIQISSACTASQ